ncbi:hypothetical protein Hanom_Chr04g00329961 [Helianthus anomalus]
MLRHFMIPCKHLASLNDIRIILLGISLSTMTGLPHNVGPRKPKNRERKNYHTTSLNRKAHPETYREEWEDEDLVLQA